MCSVCGGRRAAGASPIRCVGERITATGVPEFREVAWRACCHQTLTFTQQNNTLMEVTSGNNTIVCPLTYPPEPLCFCL
ncbi:hypothetical protein [Bathymodiolus japonicus methanotrophic gill symbiont]|uniref:hypothetical protein n=1 Tax=Bathymodiolus japonicus methanotrophic gill symbiont TaxID=113269 RepID=UPI001C8DAA98|nr:hypothetical protein [Bathymodiolus japonicus methanotrophic gill symbiont]